MEYRNAALNRVPGEIGTGTRTKARKNRSAQIAQPARIAKITKRLAEKTAIIPRKNIRAKSGEKTAGNIRGRKAEKNRAALRENPGEKRAMARDAVLVCRAKLPYFLKMTGSSS
jgi:hypothetical protein